MTIQRTTEEFYEKLCKAFGLACQDDGIAMYPKYISIGYIYYYCKGDSVAKIYEEYIKDIDEEWIYILRRDAEKIKKIYGKCDIKTIAEAYEQEEDEGMKLLISPYYFNQKRRERLVKNTILHRIKKRQKG